MINLILKNTMVLAVLVVLAVGTNGEAENAILGNVHVLKFGFAERDTCGRSKG